MLKIVNAESGKYLDFIRELFSEYVDWLGFDLCFQNYEEEFSGLPGEYTKPGGCLLLALYENKPAGCIALRKLKDDVCEMKRMYVRPQFRGKGIGKALAKECIEKAKKLGYLYMRLDTIPFMVNAIALYKSLGFKEIEPYRYNPIKGAKFMELKLK